MNFMQWAVNVSTWNEVDREGDFVRMRKGSGEYGWWHEHNDGTPYGHHPMDFKRGQRAYVCRDCKATRVAPQERTVA